MYQAVSPNNPEKENIPPHKIVSAQMAACDLCGKNGDGEIYQTSNFNYMCSFYLREFYLRNRLARKDGVTLGNRPIDLGRIERPLYADHYQPLETDLSDLQPGQRACAICSYK